MSDIERKVESVHAPRRGAPLADQMVFLAKLAARHGCDEAEALIVDWLHQGQGVVAALKRYGGHDMRCLYALEGYGEGVGACTCGFAEVMRRLEGQ